MSVLMAETNLNCPQQCPYFCSSAFRNLEHKEPESCRADLKNETHPIFAKDKFLFDPPSVRDTVDWSLLEPSLQLASRFLSMETTSRHMLNMAYGDIYLSRPNTIRRGRKAKFSDRFNDEAQFLVYPRAGRKTFGGSVQRDANLLLDDLAGLVTLVFVEDLDGPWGATLPLPGPLSFSHSLKFPFGTSTAILIDSKLLKDIAESACESLALRDSQFQLAKVLCHELGHAISYATFGEREEEPFVRNRWCSEAGFDLEAAIFGGILFKKTIDSRGGPAEYLVLEEWPSDDVVRNYLSLLSLVGLRDIGSGYTRLFAHSRSFFADVFQESFWTQRDMHCPSSMLRPQRMPCWIAKHRWTDEDFMLDDSEDESADGSTDDIKVNDKGQKQTATVTSNIPGQTGHLDELSAGLDVNKSGAKSTLKNNLRMIEHDEEHLDADIAKTLRNIIRRQRPVKITHNRNTVGK